MPAQCAGTSGEASAEAIIDDPTVKLGTIFATDRFPRQEMSLQTTHSSHCPYSCLHERRNLHEEARTGVL